MSCTDSGCKTGLGTKRESEMGLLLQFGSNSFFAFMYYHPIASGCSCLCHASPDHQQWDCSILHPRQADEYPLRMPCSWHTLQDCRFSAFVVEHTIPSHTVKDWHDWWRDLCLQSLTKRQHKHFPTQMLWPFSNRYSLPERLMTPTMFQPPWCNRHSNIWSASRPSSLELVQRTWESKALQIQSDRLLYSHNDTKDCV